MESKPKFSVGESVILQSIGMPELNGEYIVEDIQISGGAEDLEGKTTAKGGFNYKLQVKSYVPSGLWHESSLRKKHQGSEFGFTELMSVLKSPAPIID